MGEWLYGHAAPQRFWGSVGTGYAGQPGGRGAPMATGNAGEPSTVDLTSMATPTRGVDGDVAVAADVVTSISLPYSSQSFNVISIYCRQADRHNITV
jgi:hypothetical protein